MDPLAEQHQHQIHPAVRAAAEQQQWANLCSQYLPVEMANSDWKYSRPYASDDLSQGW